jgi:hypothetical protein
MVKNLFGALTMSREMVRVFGAAISAEMLVVLFLAAKDFTHLFL